MRQLIQSRCRDVSGPCPSMETRKSHRVFRPPLTHEKTKTAGVNIGSGDCKPIPSDRDFRAPRIDRHQFLTGVAALASECNC